MLDMNTLTVEELKNIKQEVELELRRRHEKKVEELEFTFEGQGYKKKSPPYCAKLTYNLQNKKIERQFFDIERTYYKNKINATGIIRAKEGDIIEEQKGYSTGKFRFISIVWNGKLVMIGDGFDPSIVGEVKGYLSGEITQEDFVKYVKKVNKVEF